MADFWHWLWSDWGKPNLLTRVGIPRFLTNLFTYLLGPYVCYVLTLRYSSAAYKPAIRVFVHSPLILLAYATFYVAVVSDWFLDSRYTLTRLGLKERFELLRHHWSDHVVRVYCLSLASSLVLLLLGVLYFRHRIN